MAGSKNKTQEMELRTITIDEMEYREEEDKPVLSGYVVRFNKLSEEMWGFREQVAPGAFLKSLNERKVFSFWNHNSDMVLGNTENDTLKLAEDERGLRFELMLPDTTAGKDARTLIKRGDVKGMSFGFRTVKDQWDESDPKAVIRTLQEVRLYEVSPTAMPAYPQSSVAARSMEDIKDSYEEYRQHKDDTNRLQQRYYDMMIKLNS
jgi:HK97 family phage prohead protease